MPSIKDTAAVSTPFPSFEEVSKWVAAENAIRDIILRAFAISPFFTIDLTDLGKDLDCRCLPVISKDLRDQGHNPYWRIVAEGKVLHEVSLTLREPEKIEAVETEPVVVEKLYTQAEVSLIRAHALPPASMSLYQKVIKKLNAYELGFLTANSMRIGAEAVVDLSIAYTLSVAEHVETLRWPVASTLIESGGSEETIASCIAQWFKKRCPNAQLLTDVVDDHDAAEEITFEEAQRRRTVRAEHNRKLSYAHFGDDEISATDQKHIFFKSGDTPSSDERVTKSGYYFSDETENLAGNGPYATIAEARAALTEYAKNL